MKGLYQCKHCLKQYVLEDKDQVPKHCVRCSAPGNMIEFIPPGSSVQTYNEIPICPKCLIKTIEDDGSITKLSRTVQIIQTKNGKLKEVPYVCPNCYSLHTGRFEIE